MQELQPQQGLLAEGSLFQQFEEHGDKAVAEKSVRVSSGRWFQITRSIKALQKHWFSRFLPLLNQAVLEGQRGKLEASSSLLKSVTKMNTKLEEVKGTTIVAEPFARAARKTRGHTLLLVTKVLMYPMACVLCSMICVFVKPTDGWHKAQNNSNRSPSSCLKFYLLESAGAVIGLCVCLQFDSPINLQGSCYG